MSAMFLGVHGASWRLLLPNNTQGLLHVSCMSKFSSHSTEGEESVHPEFPTHPGKSIWLTCRIIDQATSLPKHVSLMKMRHFSWPTFIVVALIKVQLSQIGV